MIAWVTFDIGGGLGFGIRCGHFTTNLFVLATNSSSPNQ